MVEDTETLLNVPVETLALSVRAMNVLAGKGGDYPRIHYLGELVLLSERELLQRPLCGNKTLKEIKSALKQRDLKLGQSTIKTKLKTSPTNNLFLLRPIEDLRPSVRALNVLKGKYATQPINLIGDLVQLTEVELLARNSCGRGTVRELAASLDKIGLRLGMEVENWNPDYIENLLKQNAGKLASIRQKESDLQYQNSLSSDDAKLEDELEALVRWLQLKTPQRATIWKQFWGWDGNGKKTLEEVGQLHHVTRERIRQIIAKITIQFENATLPEIDAINKAIAFVGQCAPDTKENIERLLVENGLTNSLFNIDALPELAKLLGKRTNWKIWNIKKRLLVLKNQDSNLAKDMLSLAKKLVSKYGYATIDEITMALNSSEENVKRLMPTLTKIAWLDDEHTCFTLPTKRNRLESGITKALAVTSPLEASKIKDGLRRLPRILRVPNTTVLIAFCSQFERFVVNGSWIALNASFNKEKTLSPTEQVIAEAFRLNGDILTYDEIKKACLKTGMNEITFDVYLGTSPIIEKLVPGIFTLIGTRVDPFRLDSIKREYYVPLVEDKNEYGWTADGRLWIIKIATPTMLRVGIVQATTEVTKFLTATYDLKSLNGEAYGTLKSGGQAIWPFKKAFRDKGVEINDRLIVVFDLVSKTAIIEVGDEEMLEQAKKLTQLAFDNVPDENEDEEVDEDDFCEVE